MPMKITLGFGAPEAFQKKRQVHDTKDVRFGIFHQLSE